MAKLCKTFVTNCIVSSFNLILKEYPKRFEDLFVVSLELTVAPILGSILKAKTPNKIDARKQRQRALW